VHQQGAIAQFVEQLLGHSLPSGIELIVDLADPVHPIMADPTQLELALLNLGFNARDAMPQGGQIRLRASNATLEGEVEGLRGDFVAISISDTGTGIPAEIRERVLEPFFTTKAFGQGTGLGLSQAYGFAKQSRGALALESEVGQGTTATLYLPTARDARGRAADQAGKNEADGPLILVVEDDPSIAALAEELLDELGYRALLVHSGAEALNALTCNPDINVLFSDIVMPGGITGVELAKRARQRRPELPVLLTSGYSDALGQASEFPLLAKPYRLEELAGALRALV
jgi:CheY-like chemotaxis protein